VASRFSSSHPSVKVLVKDFLASPFIVETHIPFFFHTRLPVRNILPPASPIRKMVKFFQAIPALLLATFAAAANLAITTPSASSWWGTYHSNHSTSQSGFSTHHHHHHHHHHLTPFALQSPNLRMCSLGLVKTPPSVISLFCALSHHLNTRSPQLMYIYISINNTNPQVLLGPLAFIAIQQNFDCSVTVSQDQVDQPASTGYTLILANPLNETDVSPIL
jgi:hypothetical protein